MPVATSPFTARRVASLLGGDVAWTTGDLDRALDQVSSLKDATNRSLTYCRYGGETLLNVMKATVAGATIVPDVPELREIAADLKPTLIAVARPRLAFILALRAVAPSDEFVPGIAASAIVHPTAQIDPQARLEDGVVIGPRCIVGARSLIATGTVLRADVRIGGDCIIDPGCVLGVDGFSFERGPDGRQIDFPHFGGVVIGNDVRIGAQCCVDRGTLEDTIVEDGVRIDNHSQVSHNCIVRTRSVMCGFVVLGGSVTVGEDAWISPHVVIRNQISIGARAVVGLGAVVMTNVAADDHVLGNPARRVPPLKGVRSSTT